MSSTLLRFNHGLSLAELQQFETLQKLDEQFLERLRVHDSARHSLLLAYREQKVLTPLEVSELLLACAPVLEEMLAEFFGIEKEVTALRAQTLSHDPVFAFKKLFVQRRARRRLLKKEEFESFAELDAWLTGALRQAGFDSADRELAIARYGQTQLADDKTNAETIEKLTRWCIRALTVAEGKQAVKGWVSFRLPEGIDHQKLVPIYPVDHDPIGRVQGPPEHQQRRDGFKLTDARMNAREVGSEIHYCIYCHDHDGDFCSKGFPEKKGEPQKGLKTNPLGVTLTGCPLDEKISEMHALKKDGYSVAALAMITIDNPMCAATGHRICNDCMKGCIYQKQEPVNIPQTETRILTDVLELPWGVEIYDLLIRWNPLRQKQWRPQAYNGLKVLIAGMGPAGFTLAHHLLMEGFAVVGTEGLKIESLPPELITQPIRRYADLEENLDTRIMTGFGGVAEYGITNRWDKNFLKLIYLSLLRRPYFQVFGGVRFGGTVTVEDAWELGFDHLAIAVGAGLPQALPIPGSLARGMRQANDFLMALQLTGAAKSASLANLQVRLPAVVIGGGLTGVDTATEVQAYYIVQVEKILGRYEKLVEAKGEAAVRASLDEEARLVLDEYLTHGRAVRAERERAAAGGETPNFTPLIHRWGGVTIAYRRAMNESPAYTRNHEEIIKAFEEGIYYAEALEPKAAQLDKYGHIESMLFRKQARDDAQGSASAAGDRKSGAAEAGKWHHTEEEVTLPARSVFVATGARPNVAYEFEHRACFAKEKGHYQTYRLQHGALEPVTVASHCKAEDFGAFTSYHKDDRRVSFLGDTHPVFHGSVVKAVASGMRTYPKIVEALAERVQARGDKTEYRDFRRRMQDIFIARVTSVKRLTPSVVELKLRAPLAAKRFRPGQFFRLQNFESTATLLDGTRLQTEALALAGSKVDPETGDISLMVLELGASSRLCALLRPGETVSLMGPTGVRTRIHDGGETVMIVGGRRAAATLLSVGSAMRAKGNHVLFVGGFESADEIFCRDDIEQAADVVVWSTTRGAPVKPRRPQDRAASGALIEVLLNYAAGKLEPNGAAPPIPLQAVDRLLVIGSNRLVRLVRDARRGALGEYLAKKPETIGSANSVMQCMLKGVCSQCLQWQIDPKTGHRTKAVFACSWQDEPMDMIDLDNLDERLAQNRLPEALTNQWLDYLFTRHNIVRI